jgi:hypothetical protein
MAKKIDYNSLGQAIDSTWGRSSTPKAASYSVKVTFAGEARLKVTYHAYVTFGRENELIKAKKSYEEESKHVIKSVLDNIKKSYKELTDESLSTKEESSSDAVELVGFGKPGSVKRAHYSRTVLVEVG